MRCIRMKMHTRDIAERRHRVENADLYRVLQVDPQAETEVVEAAYRRLARKYHPDTREVAGNTTPRMQELNGAWAVLRDPERRADYDRTRASRLYAFPTAIKPVPAAPPATMPVSTPPSGIDGADRRRALRCRGIRVGRDHGARVSGRTGTRRLSRAFSRDDYGPDRTRPVGCRATCRYAGV